MGKHVSVQFEPVSTTKADDDEGIGIQAIVAVAGRGGRTVISNSAGLISQQVLPAVQHETVDVLGVAPLIIPDHGLF